MNQLIKLSVFVAIFTCTLLLSNYQLFAQIQSEGSINNSDILNNSNTKSYVLFNGTGNIVVGRAYYLEVIENGVTTVRYYIVNENTDYVYDMDGDNFLTGTTQLTGGGGGLGNNKIDVVTSYNDVKDISTNEGTKKVASSWSTNVVLGVNSYGKGSDKVVVNSVDQIYVKSNFITLDSNGNIIDTDTGFNGPIGEGVPGIPIDGGIGILALMGISLGLLKRKNN
jgi:hypothetical protein